VREESISIQFPLVAVLASLPLRGGPAEDRVCFHVEFKAVSKCSPSDSARC